jgi:hypothetical protein
MSNDNDSPQDRFEHGERRALKNLILLTLPWLSFQREMLSIMKRGIEDASHVRPAENLILLEFQALLMIVDPTGKWRSYIGDDLQEKLEATYKELSPKLVSALLRSIEVHEGTLASLNEQLDKLRKDIKPGGSASIKTTDPT